MLSVEQGEEDYSL